MGNIMSRHSASDNSDDSSAESMHTNEEEPSRAIGRKLTKAESGYIDIEDIPKALLSSTKGFVCGSCVLFNQDSHSCSKVSGKIQAEATCNIYTRHGAIRWSYISDKECEKKLEAGHRLTKEEAGFIEELPLTDRPRSIKFGLLGGSIRCGTCKHYNAEKKGCFPVIGMISEFNCCNRYWPIGQKENGFPHYESGAVAKEICGL